MAITPAPVVPAPAGRGLRYGLLTAATGPLSLPDPHGVGSGVQYEPNSCGHAHLYPVDCDDSPTNKTFDEPDPVTVAAPFVAYATYTCSPVGHTWAELEARVRQRLANGEQTIAEQGLADALAAAATPLVMVSDPTRIDAVVGELEQWLYGIDGANYGQVGYLHAPVRLLSEAARHGLVVADGKLLRTHLGTIWVFGGGYPDDGTVYISGQVVVFRSDDVFVPPPAQTFNRRTNQANLIAERVYAVGFDCVAASAPFVPDVEPS
jgi:hypothetical protein